jgi:hypothetical protein
MPPLVKRYISVAFDGLVQSAAVALAVAVVGLLMTIALVIFGHLHGPWMDRAVGAIGGLIFVPFAVFAVRFVRIKRGNIDALLLAPKGFLDYKVDAEGAILEMPSVLVRLTKIMQKIEPSIDIHTGALQRASTASQQLRVSKDASLSFDKWSIRVERIQVKYAKMGELLSDGLSGWSRWIEASHPSKASVGSFPESMREFIGVLNKSNDSLMTYITILESGKGMSRILDSAIDRHVSPLRAIFEINWRIHNTCNESLRILDELT